jgi:hypothetical protein
MADSSTLTTRSTSVKQVMTALRQPQPEFESIQLLQDLARMLQDDLLRPSEAIWIIRQLARISHEQATHRLDIARLTYEMADHLIRQAAELHPSANRGLCRLIRGSVVVCGRHTPFAATQVRYSLVGLGQVQISAIELKFRPRQLFSVS